MGQELYKIFLGNSQFILLQAKSVVRNLRCLISFRCTQFMLMWAGSSIRFFFGSFIVCTLTGQEWSEKPQMFGFRFLYVVYAHMGQEHGGGTQDIVFCFVICNLCSCGPRVVQDFLGTRIFRDNIFWETSCWCGRDTVLLMWRGDIHHWSRLLLPHLVVTF